MISIPGSDFDKILCSRYYLVRPLKGEHCLNCIIPEKIYLPSNTVSRSIYIVFMYTGCPQNM